MVLFCWYRVKKYINLSLVLPWNMINSLFQLTRFALTSCYFVKLHVILLKNLYLIYVAKWQFFITIIFPR